MGSKKCNIFFWRSTLDRIPTLMALKARNWWYEESRCVLCEEGDETADHILCACGVASEVWMKVSIWCNTSPIFAFEVKDLASIHEHVGLRGKEKKVLKGIIMMACWSIWKARNDKRFANAIVNVDRIM